MSVKHGRVELSYIAILHVPLIMSENMSTDIMSMKTLNYFRIRELAGLVRSDVATKSWREVNNTISFSRNLQQLETDTKVSSIALLIGKQQM